MPSNGAAPELTELPYGKNLCRMVTTSGSHWRRWEPHIHSPRTALNDQFHGTSLEAYVAALEKATPTLAGIGITDYFTTEGYRAVRELQRAGRLQGVLLFPNIEMRLSIATKDEKGVNIHLLVSPEDPEHLAKIDEKLTQLVHRFNNESFPCTAEGIRRLGRAWQAQKTGKSMDEMRKAVDEVGALRIGANQFKVDFSALCEWRDKDPWLTANTFLAVPNGSDGAGGVGKGKGDSTWATLRDSLRRSAHMILATSDADRRYWLGQGVDSVDALERKYGGVKPCIAGSDAHEMDRVTNPGTDLCWIKAEPTWRGFLQTLVEPEDRVFVGAEPPARPRTNWITKLEVTGDPWCPESTVEFNPGLVAIIGSRGSGKTALADLIAYGSQAYDVGAASFLRKARTHVKNAKVVVHWADGTVVDVNVDPADLRPSTDDEAHAPSERGGDVLYLSQHFVEALCSSTGTHDPLRDEIERVVFERLPTDERLETSNFAELREVETEALRAATQEHQAEIQRLSRLIAEEHASESRLPDLYKRLADLEGELKKIGDDLKKTASPKAQDKQKELAQIQGLLGKKEELLNQVALRARSVQNLRIAMQSAASDAARRTEQYLEQATVAWPKLTEDDKAKLKLAFAGDFASVLDKIGAGIQAEDVAIRGSGSPLPKDSLLDLQARQAAAQKALRDAGAAEKKLADLIRTQTLKTQEGATVKKQVEHVNGSRLRAREHQKARLIAYNEVLRNLTEEEVTLKRLYGPLEAELATMTQVEKKLALTVGRRADVEKWLARGQRLFDLRKKHTLTDVDAVRRLVEEHLVPAWEGTADGAAAMTAFMAAVGEPATFKQVFLAGTTLEDFAGWLFDTDHIRVRYSISYEKTDIEQLSPGQRGVVLLILYLRLNVSDERPIIVDQPEENLDPKSVFKELVRFFKEARLQRQVFVVTHNANLVVNADADQVLIAKAVRDGGEGPPRLSYEVGVLEDHESQKEICAILEGGSDAFHQRERRYAVAFRGELGGASV